jgi:hypothetical protein
MRFRGEQVIAAASVEAPWRLRGNLYQGIRKIRHCGNDQVRLVRRHAKGTPTPIDGGHSHSRRFSADAIEGVIGDKEHLVHAGSTIRGRGIAKPLLCRIEEEARGAGKSVLWLETGTYHRSL